MKTDDKSMTVKIPLGKEIDLVELAKDIPGHTTNWHWAKSEHELVIWSVSPLDYSQIEYVVTFVQNVLKALGRYDPVLIEWINTDNSYIYRNAVCVSQSNHVYRQSAKSWFNSISSEVESPTRSPWDTLQGELTDALLQFEDDIVIRLLEDKELPHDIYSYSDYCLHENVGDGFYYSDYSMKFIEEFSEFEDTDWGMFDPRDGIGSVICYVASLTYQNAFSHYFSELIEELESEVDIENLEDVIRSGGEELNVEEIDDYVEDELNKEVKETVAKFIQQREQQ